MVDWSSEYRFLGLVATVATAFLIFGNSSAVAQSVFWNRIVEADPQAIEYEKHMVAGDEAAIAAATRARSSRRYGVESLVRRAVAAYAKAAEIEPGASEPHFRAAAVLFAYHLNQDSSPNDELAKRALDFWRAFEDRDPLDPRLKSVLYWRSLTKAKLGTEHQYRMALSSCERLFGLLDTETDEGRLHMAKVLANAAQLSMALGEVDDAVSYFQRAVFMQATRVYGYGLAVAFDRAGQKALAYSTMAIYIERDHLQTLDEVDYQFIPKSDIYAYKALGFWVLGDRRRAGNHYEQFLRNDPMGRYASLARKRLQELKD
jgi:tetratricopeptide (TPR) repeat protein